MTVTATGASTTATGNGAAKAFPFTFFAPDATQVQVYVAGALQSSGYSVTTLPGQGGTVTFDVAPANGVAVLMLLAPDFEQQVNFADGAFLPSVVNDALDQAAARDISLKDGVGRSIRVPAGEPELGELPARSSRANTFFAFDASGKPIASSGTGGADAALRTDLAANTGAALVTYLPAPTGIAAKDLQTALRLSLPVTPFHFGCVGDGVTDDHVAFQAFNDWVFAQPRPVYADFSIEIGTTQSVYVGPTAALAHGAIHYNVGGELKVNALANLDFVVRPRNLDQVKFHGRITAQGNGGGTYSTRGCIFPIYLDNCANADFVGGLTAYNGMLDGVYIPSTGSSFNDCAKIGALYAYYNGSGPVQTPAQCLTANWSSPVNSSGGSFGAGGILQFTTLTVNTLPDPRLDAYMTWGTDAAAVWINEEPYKILSVDRVNSKITIGPWLDSAVAATSTGTLTYVFGGSYRTRGGDSGIISFGHIESLNNGMGLIDAGLYGSRIHSANIENCTFAVAIGTINGIHNGMSIDALYPLDNVKAQVVNFATTNCPNYINSDYGIDPQKCWSLNGGRNSSDLISSQGQFDSLGLSMNGRHHAWVQSQNANALPAGLPISGAMPPVPLFVANHDSLSINLQNAQKGRLNQLFGYCGTTAWVTGTGTNGAPAGTITVNPPTYALASCVTTSGSAIVTVPLAGMGTRGLTAGMPVSGTGVPGGTTILSVDSRTQITLSANATASGTATLTFTGSVNGAFVAATFTGFNGPAGVQCTHTDSFENVWSARIVSGALIAPIVQKLTSAATVTPTTSQDQVHITAQAVALTLANPTGTPNSGQRLTIRLKDNGTPQTIAFGTQYRSICSTALPTTTVAGKIHKLRAEWNATDTKWDIDSITVQS